jgi:hypothetical protein
MTTPMCTVASSAAGCLRSRRLASGKLIGGVQFLAAEHKDHRPFGQPTAQQAAGGLGVFTAQLARLRRPTVPSARCCRSGNH